MKFNFNNIQYLFDERNVKDLISELNKLRLDFAEVFNDRQEALKEIELYKEDLEEAKKEITELSTVNLRNKSLEKYKEFLDSILPTPQYYTYKDNTRRRPHTIFEESIKDEEIIRLFITDMLEFDGSLYKTADELVYRFSLSFSKAFRTNRYYADDQTLYGRIEYWATAKETIEKLSKGELAFDCDDVMTLKYSCLYYLLEDYFPGNRWRLRGFIVDLWPNWGGHALLGWVKEGPNDFVPIETTFMDLEEGLIWANNYAIASQLFYQIRYSFDNNEEYVKL